MFHICEKGAKEKILRGNPFYVSATALKEVQNSTLSALKIQQLMDNVKMKPV